MPQTPQRPDIVRGGFSFPPDTPAKDIDAFLAKQGVTPPRFQRQDNAPPIEMGGFSFPADVTEPEISKFLAEHGGPTGSPVSRFVSGVGEAISGLVQAPGRTMQKAINAYNEGRPLAALGHGVASIIPIVGPMLDDANTWTAPGRELQKAGEAFQHGSQYPAFSPERFASGVETFGHGLASLPFVGPPAAELGEQWASGDPSGALGKLTVALAAPEVARGTVGAVRRTGALAERAAESLTPKRPVPRNAPAADAAPATAARDPLTTTAMRALLSKEITGRAFPGLLYAPARALLSSPTAQAALAGKLSRAGSFMRQIGEFPAAPEAYRKLGGSPPFAAESPWPPEMVPQGPMRWTPDMAPSPPPAPAPGMPWTPDMVPQGPMRWTPDMTPSPTPAPAGLPAPGMPWTPEMVPQGPMRWTPDMAPSPPPAPGPFPWKPTPPSPLFDRSQPWTPEMAPQGPVRWPQDLRFGGASEPPTAGPVSVPAEAVRSAIVEQLTTPAEAAPAKVTPKPKAMSPAPTPKPKPTATPAAPKAIPRATGRVATFPGTNELAEIDRLLEKQKTQGLTEPETTELGLLQEDLQDIRNGIDPYKHPTGPIPPEFPGETSLPRGPKTEAELGRPLSAFEKVMRAKQAAEAPAEPELPEAWRQLPMGDVQPPAGRVVPREAFNTITAALARMSAKELAALARKKSEAQIAALRQVAADATQIDIPPDMIREAIVRALAARKRK